MGTLYEQMMRLRAGFEPSQSKRPIRPVFVHDMILETE